MLETNSVNCRTDGRDELGLAPYGDRPHKRAQKFVLRLFKEEMFTLCTKINTFFPKRKLFCLYYYDTVKV